MNKMKLKSIICNSCNREIKSDNFTPNKKGAAPTAKSYNQCLRKCIDCGIGYSNSQSSPKIIYKNYLNNIPFEVRSKDLLEYVLKNSLNVTNRKNKVNSFSNANSEDALTWTVFYYLNEKKILAEIINKIVKQKNRYTKNPDVYLWGSSIKRESESKLISDFYKLSDNAQEKKSSRTEPDVILDFKEEGIIFIEVKYKSPNEVKKNKLTVFDSYISNNAFKNSKLIKESGMYELVRNWYYGYHLSDKRPFTLINLGFENLWKNSNEENINNFIKGLNVSDNKKFHMLSWNEFSRAISQKKDSWFYNYLLDKINETKNKFTHFTG